MGKEIAIGHFTFNGATTGSLPGVERVIETHRQGLRESGINTKLLVGATDFPSSECGQFGITVIEQFSSGYFPELVGRVPDDGDMKVAQILGFLEWHSAQKPLIVHNTTNAIRHNSALGVGVAKMADKRVKIGEKPVVLWVHDARKATPLQLNALLPQNSHTPLVCVSNIRAQQLKKRVDQIAEHGGKKRTNEIIVVPNPIDTQFFCDQIDKPSSLDDLAPSISQFNKTWDIPDNVNNIENVLLNNSQDVQIFLIPARYSRTKRNRGGFTFGK